MMATSHFQEVEAECPNCQAVLDNFIHLPHSDIYWTKCGRCQKKYDYNSWTNEIVEVSNENI